MFDKFWLVVIFGLLSIFFSTRDKENSFSNTRKWSCVFLCVVFIIQAGFRDWEHQLNDTINYYYSYQNLQYVSLSDLFKSFSFTAQEYSQRDPGYKIFVKLTQIVAFDFRFYLVLVSTIISIPTCRIFYKYCTSIAGIFIAACLYEALFESFFETGIRQTIAMGCSFVALEFFLKKKYVIFTVLTIIGYTIHTSALIFLPLYFLLKYSKPKFVLALCILLSPVFMYFSKEIMFYLGEDTIMAGYTSLETKDNLGTPVFSTMVIAAVIITYLFSKRISVIYPYYKLMFLSMACAIMLLPTTWVNSNFLRLELYYLFFLMPLLSVMVDVFSQRNRMLTTGCYAAQAFVLIYLFS